MAKDMRRSFPSIQFGLMVGIGGGAPSLKHDIRSKHTKMTIIPLSILLSKVQRAARSRASQTGFWPWPFRRTAELVASRSHDNQALGPCDGNGAPQVREPLKPGLAGSADMKYLPRALALGHGSSTDGWLLSSWSGLNCEGSSAVPRTKHIAN